MGRRNSMRVVDQGRKGLNSYGDKNESAGRSGEEGGRRAYLMTSDLSYVQGRRRIIRSTTITKGLGWKKKQKEKNGVLCLLLSLRPLVDCFLS